MSDKVLIIIAIVVGLIIFGNLSKPSKLMKNPMNSNTPYIVDEGDLITTLTPIQVLNNEFIVLKC
jgi:hypothetical protein